MKKLLILFILLTLFLFLSGCGVLNLSDFVLPDDIQFINTINELDTPEKICSYMKDNFTYECHISYTPNPYCLWKNKKGDCNDFCTFAIFVAKYHNYETYRIIIYFKGTSEHHVLAVFLENGKYTYSNNRFYHPIFALNFDEIVIDFLTYWDAKLKSYKVYDYNMNLIEQVTSLL